MPSEGHDSAVSRWHVSFELDGDDWEWVSIKAKHPAAAKKEVHEFYGERVSNWGYVTTTDAKQSIQTLEKIRMGREMGSFIDDLVNRVFGNG